jgi:hypothetical protein
MANLLTRMAQNALGQQPTAMPLVPPLFAAPRRADRAAEPDLPSTAATPPSLRMDSEPSLPHLRRTPAPVREEPRENAAAAPRSDASPRMAEPTLKPAFPKADPASRPGLQQVMDLLYPRRQEAASRDQRTANPPAEAAPDAATQSRVRRNDPLPIPSEASPARPTLFAAPPERPVPPPNQDSARPSINLSQSPLHNRPQAVATTSSVQITIGRIELKAAQPPAPPPAPHRAASRPAHLSLAEYQEQRRRGKL